MISMTSKDEFDSQQLDELFSALGDVLTSAGVEVSILVVGGAALTLAGWIPQRATQDVDVLARVDRKSTTSVLQPPDTLPAAFHEAARRVARDFGIPSDWINATVGAQWISGLPPSAAVGIQWRRYGLLEVGLAGRQTMIDLKLFAAVDQGTDSVHYQDLVALEPTEAELATARKWVESQDAAPIFPELVTKCVNHVRKDLGRDSADRD